MSTMFDDPADVARSGTAGAALAETTEAARVKAPMKTIAATRISRILRKAGARKTTRPQAQFPTRAANTGALWFRPKHPSFGRPASFRAFTPVLAAPPLRRFQCTAIVVRDWRGGGQWRQMARGGSG